jgi:ribokinase
VTSVVVVGSINLDVLTRCARFPDPGETVPGTTVEFGPGGKGANQARAAARAGAHVTFIGAVGDDGAGERVLPALTDAGVLARVTRTPGGTGVAVVTVDDRGENSIVVVPGANAALTLNDGDRAAIAAADVVLLQLEIPTPVVLDAARTARAAGTTVLLNPSPVRSLPAQLWALVDVVIVNRAEAAQLADRLGSVPLVITTLGADGARATGPAGTVEVPGLRVPVVDTTGAGDAFTGTLAASWDLPLEDRLTRANTAGAVATTVAGAASAPGTSGER